MHENWINHRYSVPEGKWIVNHSTTELVEFHIEGDEHSMEPSSLKKAVSVTKKFEKLSQSAVNLVCEIVNTEKLGSHQDWSVDVFDCSLASIEFDILLSSHKDIYGSWSIRATVEVEGDGNIYTHFSELKRTQA